eukprot:gnl/TRDRNA2_/TRDRNA2_170577_c1_seq10.p1 gnl/TRDRNA2_/TRDRNA2_170577_c1~~gnl/TRDRNA2_/TRDRNA2_170577_c1_seq10.p1  ORF type:complete len:282 (-),score=42.13 gnl/TRDRNA2_/TRDRNA2_170577_c1_seq10:17-862(-)
MRHGEVAAETSAPQSESGLLLRSRNTFLDVVDCDEVREARELRRTKSDSDLGSSSDSISDKLSSSSVSGQQQPAASSSTALRPENLLHIGQHREGFLLEGTSSSKSRDSSLTTPETPPAPQADGEVAMTPPMEDTGQTALASKGSQPELHQEGKCKPCKWLQSRKGCRSGADCLFCHLEHRKNDHRNAMRPVKSKRMQAKLQLSEVVDACGQNPESLMQAAEQLLAPDGNHRAQNNYLQTLARHRIDALREDGAQPPTGSEPPDAAPASGCLRVPSTRLSL